MDVTTLPNKIDNYDNSVFLAGGVVDCPDWQKYIINLLRGYNIHILNPREQLTSNDQFPTSTEKRTKWEHFGADNATVFSVWFCSDSLQPIALYELGRQLALRKNRLNTVVIGIENGYEKSEDVYLQTAMVDYDLSKVISNNINEHAIKIVDALQSMQK